jgi:hypothetical protein
MVILPPGGANRGGDPAQPRARAQGAGDVGGWLRDVAAPSAQRRGFNVPRRVARV